MTTRIEYTQEQVEVMLSHFMEGTSSLEEEAMLADYFRTHDVKDEWREYKEMFAMFDAECVEVNDTPRTEDGSLAEMPKVVELKPKVALWRGIGIAASIAVVVSLVFMWEGRQTGTEQAQVADNDTTNIVQEIERVIYDSPKRQMADNSHSDIVESVPAPVRRVRHRQEEAEAVAMVDVNVTDTVTETSEVVVDSLPMPMHHRQYRRMPQDFMAEMDMNRIINDVKARGEKIRHEVEVACSPNLY